MNRGLVLLVAVALLLCSAPLYAAGVTGQYVEARTCDVWTAPCFANAEINITGKNAVMAWKVAKGKVGDVAVDGLSVVAVVEASDTLGMEQTGPARSILIVDEKATSAQRAALQRLAREQGGKLLENVVAVRTAPIQLSVCDCEGGACAKVQAGQVARVETRCLKGKHDTACGNEGGFYPPLAKGVKATAAVAVEHSYRGEDFKTVWHDCGRRGAFVGSFETR